MKDLKYLAALSIPVTAVIGIFYKDFWSYFTLIFTFVLIPIFELLLPQNSTNYEGDLREKKKQKKLFDLMLYLNVPIVFGLIAYTLYEIQYQTLDPYEYIGVMFSLGIVLGVNGINVAHELGHRKPYYERFLGKLLLLPSMYMHFYIEHNFGHHLHAATKEDPATARYNQPLYSFWLTSVFRQYRSAWRIQIQLLNTKNQTFISKYNDMFWYTIFQITYLLVIWYFFNLEGFLLLLGAGIVGFLLLETVNYIEHYGLLRRKLPSGRYERVREVHSWNSNHVMGRIILYELTRHSDHHYKSAKKYQLLDYHDSSPQMPFGYPTSMVISFIPPLWFSVMNPRIPDNMK